jgi:very-short-patch-repair endonuclease
VYFIKKRKENNFKKYGVTDPIVLKSVRGKKTSDADRGLIKIQEGLPNGYNILENIDGIYFKLKCEKNHIFEISKYSLSHKKIGNIELCNLCNEYVGSNGEHEVYEYISTIYDKKIIRSDRKLIKPFEIDMILEDIKICIEFNGDYWHSVKINDDMYYHLNKLNMCLSKGYKLFQIRENDWNKNKDEIKRKLFNIINNIIDYKDFDIRNGLYHMDLSWYDDRIVKEELEVKLPVLIKVGQYEQWDCGYKICK